MSRSSHNHKKDNKYRNRSDFPHDDRNEGTAARTRPCSFDQIMLRRKNKKQAIDSQEKISQNNVESNDFAKVKSRKREDESSIRDLKLDKGSQEKISQNNGESNDLAKVKYRKREDESSIRDLKLDKGSQEKISQNNVESNDLAKAKSRKREDESLIRDIKLDKGRLKSVIERTKHHDSPKGDKRKNDEFLDFKHEPNKRHSRDFAAKEKYADRNQGKFEKETKRKGRYEDDNNNRFKNRERDSFKKKESLKYLDSLKKESSSSFHKRRRSRSRDRNNDNKNEKGRKSYNEKDSPSRLGGYSPRKRRTEAAIKTPSPTNHRSPEKKSATWDLPPVAKGGNFANLTNSALLPNVVLSAPVKVGPTILNTQIKQQPAVGILSGALQSMNVTVESVQLTQATRPMRRLYVENLPVSVSEEDLKKCLNDFLVLLGVNVIRGTKPCISCIINKEKGQALAEFLTPEDATNALSFDGRSFFGSVLKIRRPKDFVEVAAKTTGGDPEKSVAAPDDSMSDIVLDSPHKIFVGGVSKLVSSDMLKEIASAFGRLKAYHFEVNEDGNKACAFLEYADESVTPKACAGLNGMKLGGQMLTVVGATPKASPLKENIEKPPCYGIPELAKSLLEKPTRVLKLRNMLDPSSLSSFSEPELEEILEDVRIECARFGTVKSANVVKSVNSAIHGQNLDDNDKKENADIIEEITNLNFNGKLNIKSEPSITPRGPDDQSMDDVVKDEIVKDPSFPENSGSVSREPNALTEPLDHGQEAEIKPLVKEEMILEDKNGNSMVNHLKNVLEVGCILVEYRRAEASSVAAHCLHGRIFDGRIVTVEYVDHDFYKLRFPK